MPKKLEEELKRQAKKKNVLFVKAGAWFEMLMTDIGQIALIVMERDIIRN